MIEKDAKKTPAQGNSTMAKRAKLYVSNIPSLMCFFVGNIIFTLFWKIPFLMQNYVDKFICNLI
ncbi:LOW QUALITY PROTEIN: hypothetical protein PanWU01x14_219560 [Parasponia andersonii]|uniref:Uncharacterized protein n=1 Tax=Parasponia andersonii TaxID=3476 RepID=A0A2P5BQ97_PARAD|nr:LOW QUALITY PROTEIN: hypothetical protein PanWU01x14_219560 [Parasponia andersonii]